MTCEQVKNKLHGKTFHCDQFGGRVTITDLIIECEDGRLLVIQSKLDLYHLYESFKGAYND